MFDWIPLQYYTAIHYHVLFFIALMILFHASQFDVSDDRSIQFFNVLGYIIVTILIFYMGLRPISGKFFGDTSTYAEIFKTFKNDTGIIQTDYAFNYLMKWSSKIMGIHSFFVFVDFLYVLPITVFCRKYLGKYWFFGMFMFISSFSFWGAGVNGLRNALGASFFIGGLCCYTKKIWMYLLFALSYFMHASLIIPIFAFIIAALYRNPKAYLYIWLTAIPLSLVGGTGWSTFFAGLGFEDRTQGYLTGGSPTYNDQFSQTGFRWDFLFYSGSAIFAGWYFIFKKKITDLFYIHLFGAYCIANAFWILVITAAFSNRFAYLSWFLMPAIFSYPMFRYKIWKDQYKIFALIMFAYFMFTYLLNVIL